MKDAVVRELCSGVEGCFIQTSKFKTSRISINMFVPVNKDDVSANALLTGLLTRVSKDYPSFTALNRRLSELYGATLYGDSMKFGDMQLLRFVISCLDDKYTLDKEIISEKAVNLLLSMIFEPPLENGLFKKDDFESEKRLLIETINAEINDKRKYALSKAEELIYSGEPAGIPRYGTVGEARKVTNDQAVVLWEKLLRTAFVRVNVIGQSEPDGVYNEISKRFSAQKRDAEKVCCNKRHIKQGDVKTVEESMDVTQGKLVMAFTPSLKPSLPTAAVLTDILGGGPYSKLFTNVREKQSLCYYCAARYESQKCVITVDSGILEKNRQKAYEGILAQLEDMKNGNISDDELTASKMAIVDALDTIGDLAANIDLAYTLRAFRDESLSEYKAAISEITKQQIVDLAGCFELDSVYFLKGAGTKGEG